jgi:hypothetical protein
MTPYNRFRFCEFRHYLKHLVGCLRVRLIRVIAGCDTIVIGLTTSGITINRKSLIAGCIFKDI